MIHAVDEDVGAPAVTAQAPAPCRHLDTESEMLQELIIDCLKYKVAVGQTGSDASPNYKGLGDGSCWAGISFLNNGYEAREFASSRSRASRSFFNGRLNNTTETQTAHGELALLSLVMQEYRDFGRDSFLCMYVEMSPCATCGPRLAVLLGPNVEIHYSFLHGGDNEGWGARSQTLVALGDPANVHAGNPVVQRYLQTSTWSTS